MNEFWIAATKSKGCGHAHGTRSIAKHCAKLKNTKFPDKEQFEPYLFQGPRYVKDSENKWHDNTKRGYLEWITNE